jgi:hypothetical protein
VVSNRDKFFKVSTKTIKYMSIFKKAIYILLTIILSISISSYTISNIESKKVNTKDSSVSVNINVKSQVPKFDESLYRDLRQLLQSTLELNQSKQIAIDQLLNMTPEESIPIIDQKCKAMGYTKDILFKRARADTSIRFWTSLLIISITLFTVYYFVTKSIKQNIDWKSTLIFSILILGSFALIAIHLQNIMSYIFNSDYMTMKELIKFF